ncbi:MAG: PKD domain-containing protein, partial [Caldilinea sp.]
PSLANLTFSGNRVSGGGGAIVNRGANGTSSPTLTNVLFQGNTAFASGAMHNEAQSGGTSSPTLVNVVFYNNSASQEAGVMSNLATAGGTSTPLLVNVTAYGNSAGSGEALWRNYTDTATAGPTVVNAVLWGNSGGTLFTAAGSTISYSLVQGGTAGTGNLAVDPQFVNAAGGDLRLLNNSPAIDAGNNNAAGLAGITADLAGSARFFDSTAIADTGIGLAPIVDMGAYENQQSPVANAGVDQTVEINQGVALDGSATNGAYLPLVYQWIQVGGPVVTLSSATVAQPAFTAPAASAVLTFSLTVTDSRGLVSTPPDTVVVTVVPPMPRTVLSGNLTSNAVSNLNLTAEGTVDWTVWGTGADTSLAPVARKSGVTPRISNLVDISNGNPLRGLGQFGSFSHTFQWQDGTPTPSDSQVAAGLQHSNDEYGPNGLGEGFAVTVPADTTQRRVRLYGTYHDSFAQVTATLSDGSAPPFVAAVSTAGNNVPVLIDITYAAASIGQTLTISWVVTSEASAWANVAVFAVTLANSAQLRPAATDASGPAEPAPPPAESPEAPAAQLYLPLIVQPSEDALFAPVQPLPQSTPVSQEVMPAPPERQVDLPDTPAGLSGLDTELQNTPEPLGFTERLTPTGVLSTTVEP